MYKENTDRIGENTDAYKVLDCGIPIKRVYTQDDLPIDLEEKLSRPGEFPFTRGTTSKPQCEEPWIIRVYSGYGTPRESNERYKKLIGWGAEEIQVAVDLPTQVGYDSDHEMATGEVGKVGVAIDSLRDMEILFEEIPLNELRCVGMLGNSFGPIALSLFIALAEKQGLSVKDIVVDLQNDILKEYVARGTQIYPFEPAIRLATDVVEYCARHAPHWHPISVCVNHLNAAGAGSVKGIAYALANARTYIEVLLSKGLSIDEIAPLFSMFLDERDDFFVSVAIFRATRRIWAKMMRDYGAKRESSMALRTTAYGHGRETLQEPLNNIARIAYGTLAYVLGGVTALYNGSYDEAMSTPNEESVKVAIRTQQIIRHELGFTNVVDPLGGAFYLERLTDDIESAILGELQKVLDMGGAVTAIKNGYIRSQLTAGAVRRQEQFDRGERVSVGVNKYRDDQPVPPPLTAFKIRNAAEEEQKKAVANIRKERNNALVQETLKAIEEAAKRGENLVYSTLDAVRAYATIGEICDVLRGVFGEYTQREMF